MTIPIADLDIRFIDELGGHPVCRFIEDGIIEIVDAGYVTDPLLPRHWPWWRCKAVVAFNGPEIIGALSYIVQKDERQIYTSMAYVKREYRCRGLNSLMFEKLSARASERGYTRIVRSAHPENEASIRCIQKSGAIFSARQFVVPVLGPIKDKPEDM